MPSYFPDNKFMCKPANLRTTLVSSSTIAIAWNASNDNVQIAKIVLRITGKVRKTLKGGAEIKLDTSTLTNGTHTITVETTAQDGAVNVASRYITVNNKLNHFEKLRNTLFKPFAGTWSARTMNIALGARRPYCQHQ